jgi:hypothetical protein
MRRSFVQLWMVTAMVCALSVFARPAEVHGQVEPFNCSDVSLYSGLTFSGNQVRFTIVNRYLLPLTLHHVNLDWDILPTYPWMGVGMIALGGSIIWSTFTPDQVPPTVIGASPSEAPFTTGATLTIPPATQDENGAVVFSQIILSFTLFNGPISLFPTLQSVNFDGTVIEVMFGETVCPMIFSEPTSCPPNALRVSTVDFSLGNGLASFDLTNTGNVPIYLKGFALNWRRYGQMTLWRASGGASLGSSLLLWEYTSASGDSASPTAAGTTPLPVEGTWVNNLTISPFNSTRIYIQFLGVAGFAPLPIAMPGVRAAHFNGSAFYVDIPDCSVTDLGVAMNPAPIEFVANGNFDAGIGAWGLWGDMVYQSLGSVFQFRRPVGGAGTVIFQESDFSVAAGVGMSVTFQAGNSGAARQRLSVLVHDADFSDSVFCTFWLLPNQPLQTYRINFRTARSWGNAALSFYASTGAASGWITLDSVAFVPDDSAPAAQTRCQDANLP